MNINDLLALATVIKNENVANANTAERVGYLFAQIIESYLNLTQLTADTGADANKVIHQAALTALLNSKVDKSVIKQTGGESTTDLMSQKTVTDLINALSQNKIDKSAIKQALGASLTDIISQAAVTGEINRLDDILTDLDGFINDLFQTKIDKSAIKQVLGESETDVVSQRALYEIIGELQAYKISTSAVKQAPGASLSDLMSQKAISQLQTECNVTVEVPLGAGYYTFATARAAVPADRRKAGLKIIFLDSAGVWNLFRFDGSSVADWAADEFWNSYNPKIGTGASMTDYISQLGVTYLLGLKLDVANLVESLGNSSALVPTQNGLTTQVNALNSRIDGVIDMFNNYLYPDEMQLVYPSKITLRNPVLKYIVAIVGGIQIYNLIYDITSGSEAMRIKPNGRIELLQPGLTKISVIPTHNTHIYKDIEIEVATPAIREVTSTSFRLSSNSTIRLT